MRISPVIPWTYAINVRNTFCWLVFEPSLNAYQEDISDAFAIWLNATAYMTCRAIVFIHFSRRVTTWILLPWCLYFTVDPPGSPDKDRQVRNLSISSIAIGEGYRFTVNLTWIPPLYPYKTIEIYYILGYGSTTVSTLRIVLVRAVSIKGAEEPR